MSDLPGKPKRWIAPLLLAASVVALWSFPKFWYAKRSSDRVYWYAERENIPGWTYTPIPVAKAAEAVLVGDRMVNGDFTAPDRTVLRVFSAKRYHEKANEIGLFMHTPDRCWIQAGWKLEPAEPEVVEVDLHGVRIPLERRIFVGGGQRELVYFAGLVSGEPLPYRLDHHLSVAKRFQVKERSDNTGAAVRASDRQYWNRLWDSFTNRRQLLGPKHFFRISTPILGEDLGAADQRLKSFLPAWLPPVDYATEENEWRTRREQPGS